MTPNDVGTLERVERAALERDAAIDAAQRKRHGIVHTPAVLASFVARSVDAALREIGRDGLGDSSVAIVDPACGPGIFLAAAADVARGTHARPRVALGLDLDADALGRARSILAQEAWPFRLERADTLASLDVLRDEEHRGSTLVVLGNPPWAGRSETRGGPLLERLLDDFRRDETGRPLRERKIGVLSDAYVRFWRWSCELARRAEAGAVVALVTNASFLDGPVHRGMRAALARYFARIDVVHLGGSALVARRGDRDENLFAVRPAAALTLALRPPGHVEHGRARVRFTALRGSRAEKLAALERAASIDALAPEPLASDAVRWTPGEAADERYLAWPSIGELMPFHREGVQSNRDAFCVDDDRARLLARLRAFAAGDPGPWPGGADVESPHYDPERARAAVREILARDPDAIEHVVRVAYRPLEPRWMALVPKLCHRPRPDLREAMRRSELALVTVRKDRGERAWACFAIVRDIPDNCFLSARSSCRARAFPTRDPSGAENLDAAVLAAWGARLDEAPRAADVARYACAMLAAPSYRARFDAALRADYPRVPPPPSAAVFRRAVRAGAALEEAFASSGDLAGDAPVVVGHHVVPAERAGRLAAAIAMCEHAFVEVFGAAEAGRTAPPVR